MRILYKIAFTVATAICLFAGVNASAQQTLRSGYFLDGYNYKYKLNPALGNDLNFISIPALGHINVSTSGNVGLSTFLFPNGDGTLNTFLSPKVSNEEFLSGIKDRNILGADINESIFAFGFHDRNTYHTFDISVKGSAALNVPGAMFKFIKQGSENTVVDNMGFKTNALVEVAYGFSTKVSEKVTIGARIKGIGGFGYTELELEHGNIVANGDIWKVDAKGTLETGGYLSFDTKKDSKEIDYNLPRVENNVVAQSFGGALDLGVKVDLSEYLNISFAALDLGVIMWNNVAYAETPSTQWDFKGFNTGEGEGSVDDQFDEMMSELSDCFTFYQSKSEATNTKNLAPTLSAGVEYIIPSFEKLSVGGLLTKKFDGIYGWFEARGSVNFAPCRWFSMNVSAAESTYGFSTGAMLNIHGQGVNLFVGTDNLLPWSRVSNYGIPVDSMTSNITFGLNITFGKYIGRFPKIKNIIPEIRDGE